MIIVHVAVAFLIALVSGLGVGGGGLFATYLALFTTIPQLSVQGFNLLFFLFCAGASVLVQLFRRKINFVAVAIMLVSGLVGALVGTLLSRILPQDFLRKLFGIMLTATGINSLRTSMSSKYSKKHSTVKDGDIENTTENKDKTDEKQSGSV